ncbi:hypothetical protein EMGBS15_15630 [Filimonas sp.]|nr:hypothetical protein EMGBS15_15630 [Filimonas sp.]
MGVVTIVFLLFFVILPADPARLTMGQRSDAKSIANIRKELYLDKPLYTQYALYLNDLSPLSIHESSAEVKEKYQYHTLFSVSGSQRLVWKAALSAAFVPDQERSKHHAARCLFPAP